MKKIILLFIMLYGTMSQAATKKPAVVDLTVIEVTDTSMENVYYHQTNFATPTKLVFTNLTSVSGYVYFHQTTNLVEVEFPALVQTGNYFYFHQNLALTKIKAPLLQTVHGYLYANGNTSLTELNVCSLTQILPIDQFSTTDPYYYIHNNTPAIDAGPYCFSLGGPSNLALSDNSISENLNPNTLIGILSATSNYPNGTLTYSLPQYELNNNLFKITGNQLKSNTTFDYETGTTYQVRVKVMNQLGESTTSDFTIHITNVINENLTVIQITDTTLDNVYYHQVSFPTPTKLVFTNLTSVSGYVYFHQNPNLVEVEFPVLLQTGSYFYVHQNQSLTNMKAPVLNTVHGYLHVSGNNVLTELNVCNLTQILPLPNPVVVQDPYYYIENNPLLNFSTTCLINTTITYTPANPIIVLPAPNTLIGTFSSDATGNVTYFFADAQGNPTTNPNFVIVGNGLYLANEYDTYQQSDFTIDIGSIRVNSSRMNNTALSTGLNQKKITPITFSISNVQLGLAVPNENHFSLSPNPCGDYFTINTVDGLSDFDVKLFDLNGKLLLNQKAQNLQPIEVNRLESGIYILNICSEKITQTVRLVKK